MQGQKADAAEHSDKELLLDAALEAIPYGFCVWSREFRLVMWNKNYRDIYGFSFDRMRRGMTLMEVVEMSAQLGNHPGQTAQQFYDAYTAELLANRHGARTKVQETVDGGRTIETGIVYSPRIGWVVTHEDVTEEIAHSELVQKRKRDLERQNIRLDAAVNNISQGLAMFDARGRLVISNKPYARIYELPAKLLQPGTLIESVLTHLFERGMSTGKDRDDFMDWRRDIIANRTYGKTVFLLDGRTIIMQHHPMEDGGFVSTHEDITAQLETEAQIRHLARHDALTNLPNRMAFHETMERLAPALKRGESAAVLSVNLDRFKAVNETAGQAIGDQVLKTAAERMGASLRETDTLARLGGDEFALLLAPIDDPAAAGAVADRIIAAIAEPMAIERHRIAIGASIGISMAPGDGTDADALLKNADLALERAKSEGRGTYHFFESEMDAALRKRRTIEAGLARALERRELRLVYQPLVGLKEDRIIAFEALLRWDNAETGDISPAEFIPVAEQTGLIVPIGEWVLEQACREAASWPTEARIAVNLSAVQFRVRNLVDSVKRALKLAKLPATRLELEITESLLLEDSEQVLKTLHSLRALGVRISMDDFGTGYSSLSYLRSFPFDKIKIDRSFMRDLEGGKGDSRAIIKAVIGLGHSLGMSTTAEGVETEEQLAAVRDEGCDEVQGFYFSPPVMPAEIPGMLVTRPRKATRLRRVS